MSLWKIALHFRKLFSTTMSIGCRFCSIYLVRYLYLYLLSFLTSKMAQKSEIVAILASGVSYRRLLVPYVISAVFLAIVSFAMFAWIIPHADKTRVVFENKYIRDRSHYNAYQIKTQIAPGQIMSMGSFNFSE